MNNFTLINQLTNNSEEISIFKHRTGLEVVFIKTKDDNNTFCASFKTEPENDKGIPHILEHIVLCGSKKYLMDDPFNELVKGTLFSYLNAITYSDKTIYPVSSRNKKEFEKMYKVYLDAVFNPLLLKEAFLKEGVRKTEKGYSGIVFNEMSSAYNDIECIISYHTNKIMFDKTPYSYDSGGNPKYIKDTTYEDILEYYKKNYCVSKASLFFYGDLDIDYIFEYLEENYLSDIKIDTGYKSKNYLLENKHIKETIKLNTKLDIFYYSICFSFEKFNENKFYLDELGILFDFLLESDTSILTTFLKDKYNLIDISYDFDTESFYPNFSIILKSEERLENSFNIYDEIISFLNDIASEGLDIKELKALISLTNFKYIEEDFGYKSKGLSMYLDMLNFFLYSDDREYVHIAKNLNFEKLLENAEKGYFNQLLKESLVNCKNSVFIEFLQDENFIEEEIETIEDEYIYVSGLDNNIKIETIDFSEVEDFKEIEFTKIFDNGNEINYTSNGNKEISFLTLAFETQSSLTDVGILLELIGETKTKFRSRKDLKIISDHYIGDFDVSFESIITVDGVEKNYIIFEIKALNKYLKNALEIIEEIINYSDYSDEGVNKSKINELILDFEEELNSDNARLGIIYSYKDINKKYANKHLVEGLGFFERLKIYKKNSMFDFGNLNTYFESTKEVKTFVATNDFRNIENSLKEFLNKLKLNKKEDLYVDNFKIKKSKEYLKNNSSTYTNILTGKVNNIEYSGVLEVFSSIIKNEYFNNEIRLKGGAYGYDISFDYDMFFHMYSVDDPNQSRTKKIFESINEFILNYDLTEEQLNQHIIGTVNSFDNFKCFYDKYYLFVLNSLKKIEKGFFLDTKKNILGTNRQKIIEISDNLNKNISASHFLSIGK